MRLAGEGAAVAACGRTLANVEATAAEMSKTGGKATAYAVDVANSAQVAETCEKILKEFGRVDVLVNNAGVTRDQLLLRMSGGGLGCGAGYEPEGRIQFYQGGDAARC